MTDERPKWPESLPPPSQVEECPRQVLLMTDDLAEDAAIHDIVHDLYWFPDDEYFLFFVYGDGIGASLNKRLKEQGVVMKKTEMYFYRHPSPAYKNDFIRVMPHSEAHLWQKEAAMGTMYGRISLSLEPARRKQIDLAEIARVTTDRIADKESIVDVKPNFFGMGVNLNSLWRRTKRWFGPRKQSNE